MCTKRVEIPNVQKLEEIGAHWSEIFAKLEFNERLEMRRHRNLCEEQKEEMWRLEHGVPQAITSLGWMLFEGIP